MIRAIIIDDDMNTLEGLSRAVPWDQFDVEICGLAVNGAEGLQLIEQIKPQLILTDIFMPVMDGIEMLKCIRAAKNDAEVIILSGYEDFKYAQSAVKLNVADYLSKPATVTEIQEVIRIVTDRIRIKLQDETEDKELRELVEFHRPQTKKLLMKGLLETDFCNTPFYEKSFKHLQMNFKNQSYSVALIEYAVPRDRLNVKRSDVSIYTFALRNMIEEMSEQHKEVFLADIQQNVIALIVSMPQHLREETAKQRVKYIVTEYVENIKNYLRLEVWVAVGNVVHRVHDIASSYKVAMNLLARREFVGDIWFINEENADFKPQKLEVRHLVENYHELIRSVMEGEVDHVKQQIGQLTNTLSGHNPLSVHLIRSTVIELIGMLMISLYDQGIFVEDIDSKMNLYTDIEGIHHIDDFSAYLLEVLIPINEALANRGTHKHRKTVDFMKRYVLEHYAEDVTLDVIADKVFLTRNYLSQIFKQVTGENYNNYITRVRMEKAKELMLLKKYKLYEITEMVGYKNNAYFSQQFKKHTGKNPSEFC
ncbi:MAG TPA: response regulator [Candidatus Paenibacillus intestinavium]|nr:response regulator [Candidatus Paenibacillus intestinavium]